MRVALRKTFKKMKSSVIYARLNSRIREVNNVKDFKVTNPLSLIAIFASLAESISLGILPLSSSLAVHQVDMIIKFAAIYPFFMGGMFWLVLIIAPENLFSPEEHKRGDEKYQKNVMKYKEDKETSEFLAISEKAKQDGREKDLYANIEAFLFDELGISAHPVTFMLDPANNSLHDKVIERLKELGWNK